MNNLKMKLLDELLSHLADSQGGDLKSLLDESKKPPIEELGMSDDLDEEGNPKGLKVESIEVMGAPKQGFDQKVNEAIADSSDRKKPAAMIEGSDEPEMDDDEIAELLRKYS